VHTYSIVVDPDEDSLDGGGEHGQLVITRNLGGRMAEWRVQLADLGARLGELTSLRG
jgi:hypothetical protein